MTHTPTCMRWIGAHDDDGYGRIQKGNKWRTAHRVQWELLKGAIPSGLVIDHLCRTRNCINVQHMELVTPKENTLRGFNPCAINARKVSCIKGHELSGKNLTIRKDGHRECRECRNAITRAYYHRQQVIAKTEAK